MLAGVLVLALGSVAGVLLAGHDLLLIPVATVAAALAIRFPVVGFTAPLALLLTAANPLPVDPVPHLVLQVAGGLLAALPADAAVGVAADPPAGGDPVGGRRDPGRPGRGDLRRGALGGAARRGRRRPPEGPHHLCPPPVGTPLPRRRAGHHGPAPGLLRGDHPARAHRGGRTARGDRTADRRTGRAHPGPVP